LPDESILSKKKFNENDSLYEEKKKRRHLLVRSGDEHSWEISL